MEGLPSEAQERQMFLTKDQLMLLETEVWDSYAMQVEHGFISQELAEVEFVRWRRKYLGIPHEDTLQAGSIELQ